VEHHLDVIAAADWIIELGPGGGVHGGNLVAAGTPDDVRNNATSPTGRALHASHHGTPISLVTL
jgi:excinuclease ABC subunit A